MTTPPERMYRNPKLFSEVEDDLTNLGLGHCLDHAVLLWIGAMSRLIDPGENAEHTRSVNVDLRGPSAVGKTTAVDQIARLVLPEDRIFVSSLTMAALSRAGDLRGKFVVFDERIEDPHVDALLRQLVHQPTVERIICKNNGKEYVQEHLVLNGPITMCETRVLTRRKDHQDANRLLSIDWPSAEECVDAIQDQIRRRFMERPNKAASSAEAIRRKHHALQELFNRKVNLRIPPSALNQIVTAHKQPHATRTLEHILNLIAGIAFLRQGSKQVSTGQPVPTVTADINDYELARRLLIRACSEDGPVVSEEEVVTWKALRKHYGGVNEVRFSITNAADKLSTGYFTMRRRLLRLAMVDVVVRSKTTPEHLFELTPFGKDAPPTEVASGFAALPSTDEMRQHFK